MPIPVCKFARANLSKAFKGISKYEYCASKKETYFGFKLHALIATNGYITNFMLTAANVDDRTALWELTSPYKEIKIIGDKEYVSDSLENELINERGILLLALQRKKGVVKIPEILYQKSEDM